ncbi:hypothetical protein AV530_014967 [Patagioenas fasciata monilis]|uniref:Uncharacterized protein n=1 Tax=Patagioenas fasciata monilis TaxID=372326 RepID=A0A1V4K0P6_PATFA|nr:hypothetical protein AV530_014967 [Patagioenas fasciata monilis]
MGKLEYNQKLFGPEGLWGGEFLGSRCLAHYAHFHQDLGVFYGTQGNLFAWLFVLLSPWLYAVNLKIIRDSCMVAQTSPSSSGISGMTIAQCWLRPGVTAE